MVGRPTLRLRSIDKRWCGVCGKRQRFQRCRPDRWGSAYATDGSSSTIATAFRWRGNSSRYASGLPRLAATDGSSAHIEVSVNQLVAACLSTAIAKSHKDRYMNHDHAYPATQPARPSVVRTTKRQRRYNQELNRAKRWHPSNKADGRKHLRAVKVRR